MKNVLTVIGLTGLLALVLTVRAFAAPTTQLPPTPTPAAVLQQVTTTPTAGQATQNALTATLPAAPQAQDPSAMVAPANKGMGMHGGMMSEPMGGKRGRMGMRGGMRSGSGMTQGQTVSPANAGSSMYHKMLFGVDPMHNDIAAQLGMTAQDVYNHMASGKSLVQMAAEKGITEQQLMDNIMAGRRAAYEQAVMEGRMTQAQADRMLMNIQDNLQSMVNGQGTGSTGWSMMWETQP